MKSLSRRQFVRNSVCGIGIAAGGWTGALGQALNGPGSNRAESFLAAVAAGDVATVRRLLASDKTLVALRDRDGRSPFTIACLARHPAVAQVLREHGHVLDLHEAAFVADWDYFDPLARTRTDAVNESHPIGGTAMYAAALGGAGSSIWHVYQHGADPNLRGDPAHKTPLRAAFDHPDLAVCEMTASTLLGNNALPNVGEPQSSSPLHAAAARGSLELVETLIRKGASVNARDSRGRTPLDLAQEQKFAEVVELLRNHRRIARDHSTSRTAYDVEGKSYSPPDISDIPYRERGFVVGQSHRSMTDVRERVDANPRLAHSVATTGERAVEACGHMGRKEIVDYLLDHGAPYSLPTSVMRGDRAAAQRLLKQDPLRIHERGPHDFALLWYPIIGGGNLEMAHLLLDAGARPESQHYLGTTALHWAAMRGQREMAELLLDHGADPNRPGRKFGPQPKTPLDHARERGHSAMVELLKDHGAS